MSRGWGGRRGRCNKMPVGNVTVAPGDSPRRPTMISHVTGRMVGNSRNTTGRCSRRIQQLLHRVAEKWAACSHRWSFWGHCVVLCAPGAGWSECQRPFPSRTDRRRTVHGSELKNVVPEIVRDRSSIPLLLIPAGTSLMPSKSKIVSYALQSFATM